MKHLNPIFAIAIMIALISCGKDAEISNQYPELLKNGSFVDSISLNTAVDLSTVVTFNKAPNSKDENTWLVVQIKNSDSLSYPDGETTVNLKLFKLAEYLPKAYQNAKHVDLLFFPVITSGIRCVDKEIQYLKVPVKP